MDYIDWIQVVDQIWHNSDLVSRLGIEPVPEEDVHCIMVGLERASELAVVARDNGVRMMVDAEQTYFQVKEGSRLAPSLIMFRDLHRSGDIAFNYYMPACSPVLPLPFSLSLSPAPNFSLSLSLSLSLSVFSRRST